MGLIVALSMTGIYWAGLLFTARFLRARSLAKSKFTYLVLLTLCAFLLLPVSLAASFLCLRLFGLLGPDDIEIAGIHFAYMSGFSFSIIVMVLILIKEIWRVFRSGEKDR